MRGLIADANAASKTGAPVLHRKPNREWAGDMPRREAAATARMVAEPRKPTGGRQLMRTPSVDLAMIDSPEYRKAFGFFKDEELGDLVCRTARDMLRHRSGTVMEDFAAVSISGGAVATKRTTSSERKGVSLSRDNIRAISDAKRGDLVAVHNHPESMPPSASDFLLIGHRSFRYGIIACHNGRVVRYRVADRDKFGELVAEGRISEVDGFLARNLVYWDSVKTSSELAAILERRYGVTYEELA